MVPHVPSTSDPDFTTTSWSTGSGTMVCRSYDHGFTGFTLCRRYVFRMHWCFAAAQGRNVIACWNLDIFTKAQWIRPSHQNRHTQSHRLKTSSSMLTIHSSGSHWQADELAPELVASTLKISELLAVVPISSTSDRRKLIAY